MGPVFAGNVRRTCPFPVPVAPEATVIHDALLVAVHAQPAPAVTLTVPWAASGRERLASVGSIEYVQAGTNARCVTVKVRVAIVTVPVRSPPVFAVSVRRTCPFPVPGEPEATVIHGALLAAVHAQPAPAVTLTVPWAASGPMFADVGSME